MRSKSEAMIAMSLYVQKIPYRYECELKLGSITLFPDFTIRHPETGEIFYWEHFGMMDKPEYVKNASDKISLYMKYGIYPNDKLLVSYETQKQPLSTEQIDLAFSADADIWKTIVRIYFCFVPNSRPHD